MRFPNAKSALSGLPIGKIPFRNGPRPVHQGMAKRTVSALDWIFLPTILVIVLTYVCAAPIRIGPFVPPEPVFALGLAFAWPLIRPSFLAAAVLMGIGLFLDFFWMAPLGFYTFLLLGVYFVLVLVRSYVVGQDQWVVFGIYGLCVLAFFTVGTVVISLEAGNPPRLVGVLEQMLATGLGYILAHNLMETYLHTDVRFK